MSSKSIISRRSFLKNTGAASIAAPLIVRASALGAEPKAAAGERITVGMIGVGRQAYLKNMKQFLGMGDVQVLAICDVDAWRLENAKQAIEAHYSKG